MLLDFYVMIAALPPESNKQRLNAKFGSVVNVHVSARNFVVIVFLYCLHGCFLAAESLSEMKSPRRCYEDVSLRCGMYVIMKKHTTACVF